MDEGGGRKEGLPKLREILRRQRDETDISVGEIDFMYYFIFLFINHCRPCVNQTLIMSFLWPKFGQTMNSDTEILMIIHWGVYRSTVTGHSINF